MKSRKKTCQVKRIGILHGSGSYLGHSETIIKSWNHDQIMRKITRYCRLEDIPIYK